MSDDLKIFLTYLDQQYREKHHTEQQRSTIASLLFIIAAAALAFIARGNMSIYSLPLAILIVVIGLFGILITRKYYQLYHMSFSIMKVIWKKIANVAPKSDISKSLNEANEENKKKFPLMHNLSLHGFWIVMYMLIAFCGVIIIITIMFRYFYNML